MCVLLLFKKLWECLPISVVAVILRMYIAQKRVTHRAFNAIKRGFEKLYDQTDVLTADEFIIISNSLCICVCFI